MCYNKAMDNRSKNKARVSAVARCGYVAFILLAVGFLLYFLLCSLTLNMWFRAMVRDADRVVIRDGGNLRGILRGAHLQVEEGGGLSARVFIWPQDTAP